MSTDSPKNNSLIGLTVDNGRYEIIKLIGEGGMGQVFQARQISMNRLAALKILRAQMATDPQLLARFQQEAQAVSRLRHPNTITYYDYGRTEDDYLFIAMELLGGQSLFSLLRSQGRLSLERTLHIMEQVCGAVSEAHSMGIVHRDLKPENIQIDQVGNEPDFVKVLDFGIAKIIQGDSDEEFSKSLTMAGTVFGTPHYMSPEQVHGQRVDHRTDIYSLGIILFELLAGHPPFDGATPMAVMMAQASKELPDIREMHAELLPGVATMIERCLTKDRADRFESVDQLINEIRQVRVALMGDGSVSGQIRISGPATPKPFRNPMPETIPPPRQTLSPSIDSQADALQTPDHAGQLATISPITEPDVVPLSKRRGKILALVGLALAVAVVVTVVVINNGDRPPAPKTTATAVVKHIKSNKPVSKISYTIRSTPAGAEVYSGDTLLGQTPYTHIVSPGQQAGLSIQLEGYQDSALGLNGLGEAEQTITVDLEALEKAVPVIPVRDWFEVTSIPLGADVFCGDTQIGKTPFKWAPPTGEDIPIRFELKGYHPHTRTIIPKPSGKSARPLQVKLKRRRIKAKPKPRPKPKPKPKPTYEKL